MAKLVNPSTTLLLVALLCVSAVAATRTKLHSINNRDDGICKSMVETQGYTCQEHKVATEDGYILGLRRIPSVRSGNEKAHKLPVLLQHGLLMDAAAWVFNPPDKALVFILADNGFDVWLSNARGTNSSRGHTSLSPNDPAYWECSWDELAAYDLPALFHYVHNQTGQKLHYVGHSLGTLVALAAFSQEKLLDMLRSAALLSPIAYLGQVPSLFARIVGEKFLTEFLYISGLREFLPNRQIAHLLLESICTRLAIDCSNLIAIVAGPNCCLSSSSINLFLKNAPQSTATKNVMHLAQMLKNGTIEKFDYGLKDRNMKYNRQPTPPEYNMTNIPKEVPLFFSYGGKDTLSDVDDVKILLENLRDHDKDKLAVKYIDEYAHFDFLMGVNAHQVVYDPLLDFFRLH